jgi:hypothetical protein
MQAPPSVHAYVAADAQGDQCFIFVVVSPMMNDQARSDATALAAEAIAPDYALAPPAEETQGMLAPVVRGTAAAQPFQLDMLPQGQSKASWPALLHSSRSSRLSIGC